MMCRLLLSLPSLLQEDIVQQQTTHHPYASVLRQRAGSLRELAATIERSLVMALGDEERDDVWDGLRPRLCEQMLTRNLHQLHLAADELRHTAFRFLQRADELDVAHHSAA